jgi:hypothetical protein
MNAVACSRRGVVAAGRQIARCDLEGACEVIEADGLDGVIRHMAVNKDAIAVVTEKGALQISRDGGAHFLFAAPFGDGDLAESRDVIFDEGRLLVLARAGVVYASDDLGDHWTPVAERIEAIAPGVMLATNGEGHAIAVLRGRERIALPESPRLKPVALLAARGKAIACGGRGAPMLVSVDGVSFTSYPSLASASAAAFLDDEGTLAVALYGATEDTSWLACVDKGGRVETVAELGRGRADADPEDDQDGTAELLHDGCAVGLTQDDAHGVIWVVGGFGLLALERPSE